MRRVISVSALILITLLSACGSGTSNTPLPPTLTPSGISNDVNAPTPSPSPTNLPTLAPTATLTPIPPTPTPLISDAPIRCAEDYCIYDQAFFLNSPIDELGMQMADVTYRYGSTSQGASRPHSGIEFQNNDGYPVLAADDGIVVFNGNDKNLHIGKYFFFYGNVIILKHSYPGLSHPIFTLYGHLSKSLVVENQTVKAGEKIAEVGDSGLATGSHLHFEVREGKEDYASITNPELWLKPVRNSSGQQLGTLVVHFEPADKFPLKAQKLILNSIQLADSSKSATYYAETYDKTIPTSQRYEEKAVFGNIEPGEYELNCHVGGVLYRIPVKIEAGKLTLASIKLQE